MTAIEWYYEQTVIQGKTNYWELLEQAKEMEKQQIKDAWFDGYGGSAHSEDEYYNETYGSKGSDVMTPENHIGVLSEAVKKETTSSQTEISDEEIEKAANNPVNDGYSFIEGAKWYREYNKKNN